MTEKKAPEKKVSKKKTPAKPVVLKQGWSGNTGNTPLNR